MTKWAGGAEGLDRDCDTTSASQGRCDSQPSEDGEAADGAQKKEEAAFPVKKINRTEPLGTRAPDDRQEGDIKNHRRQQNDGGLDRQSCQAEDARLYCCGRSESNVGLVEQGHSPTMTRR